MVATPRIACRRADPPSTSETHEAQPKSARSTATISIPGRGVHPSVRLRLRCRRSRLLPGDLGRPATHRAALTRTIATSCDRGKSHGCETRRLRRLSVMSARLDPSWRVLASPSTPAVDRCVDIFTRPDGTFGFEEFRRDPEDMGAWTPVAYYSERRFSTEADVLAASRAAALAGRRPRRTALSSASDRRLVLPAPARLAARSGSAFGARSPSTERRIGGAARRDTGRCEYSSPRW